MMAKGLAAVQERIRKSFLEVHNDQRTREQRQADEEMLASIQKASPLPQAKTEVDSLVERSNILKSNATEQRANAYVSAALRSPQIRKHTPCRGNVGHAWEIESPAEDVTTLIGQALRQLRDK